MPSKRSDLRIENQSDSSCVTYVSDMRGSDWDGGSRPDKNFNNVTIPSKKSVQRKAKLNVLASNCPFTMSLRFKNGLVDTFKVNQKFAIGKAHAGFIPIEQSHDLEYKRDGHILVITIKDTKEHNENTLAEKKKREGEASMKQKQYEAAIRKLDEALKLAHDAKTFTSIKNDKAEACHQLGNSLLQQAWDLEAHAKAQDAKTKFTQAKSWFQQAETLRHSTQQQNSIKLITLKNEGNQLFNEANELEKQGFQLFETARKSNMLGDYTTSQNKYKEALAKYEAAKKKFEEGAKLDQVHFGISLQITAEEIDGVLNVIDNIDKAELNYKFEQVHVSEKQESKEEEVHLHNKLQEQREG